MSLLLSLSPSFSPATSSTFGLCLAYKFLCIFFISFAAVVADFFRFTSICSAFALSQFMFCALKINNKKRNFLSNSESGSRS